MGLPSSDREPSVRTIDPLGLVFASGRWYLLALRDGENRTYRLSRMTAVIELAEPARRSATVDIEKLWASRLDQFRSTIERIVVVLDVAPSRRAEVADSAIEVIGSTGGRMTVAMGGELHVQSLMWSLGDDGELLEPAELREKMSARARSMADRHRPR